MRTVRKELMCWEGPVSMALCHGEIKDSTHERVLKVRRHLEDLGHGYNEMKTAGKD